MNIRQKVFWIIDFLKGGRIKKHYDDIKFQLENYTESTSIREKNLDDLLVHVQKTVPFYQIGMAKALQDFPVVNKLIITQNKDKFISTKFKKVDLISVTTSGSTGTPFTVYKDKNKVLRHQAENIYFGQDAGYEIGTKLYYLRVWNNVNKKSYVQEKVLNIEAEEIGNISDRTIESILNRIESYKGNKSILGFASTLEAIAKFIQNNPLFQKKRYHVVSIQSMSETLPEGAKSILGVVFNCAVISRYSNMENGFIAQQRPNLGDDYQINYSSFIVEILNLNDDNIVEEGNLGRIVITDLFNYGMPLVRYDTGDLGRMYYNQFGVPILSSIEGRKVDFIYNGRGELMSPHFVTNTMWKYQEVAQFQFVQKSKDNYTMKLNVDHNDFKREVELADELRKYLGNNVFINFEYVNEIPLMSSGKRKKIINEYIPQ